MYLKMCLFSISLTEVNYLNVVISETYKLFHVHVQKLSFLSMECGMPLLSEVPISVTSYIGTSGREQREQRSSNYNMKHQFFLLITLFRFRKFPVIYLPFIDPPFAFYEIVFLKKWNNHFWRGKRQRVTQMLSGFPHMTQRVFRD